MRCIICKLPSSPSEPREHILPQGLGNTEHVLRRGAVCGKCNNYFASKVEKPFLELAPIVAMRSDQAIPSKKGIVPTNRGVLMPTGAQIETRGDLKTDRNPLGFSKDSLEALMSVGSSKLILSFPALLEPSQVVSRFVGKVGLEALAFRLERKNEWLEELTDNIQLDELRQHVRYGRQVDWPVSIRRIYDAEAAWTSGPTPPYQIVHEFDFLVLENSEFYFVLALFGQEFVINLGGPSLDGWLAWLRRNDGRSPLHCGKNENSETQVEG